MGFDRKIILPFDIGFYDQRHPDLPEFLPFELRVDRRSGLICQKTNASVRRALKLYYTLGGYASTPLGEGDYGQRQGDEVFSLLESAILARGRKISEMSFLEIGAGYGYLLYRLKQSGAKLTLGLEPGNEGVVGARKYQIRILQEFFPTNQLQEKFDCVFSYGVLEHIENPRSIFKKITEVLNQAGIIFMAVPDCEMKMAIGDPSIISHQHVNYFTKDSMTELLASAGFTKMKIESHSGRTMLIASAIKTASGHVRLRKTSDDARQLTIDFWKNLRNNVRSIQKLIDELEKISNNPIGFYGAGCSVLKGLLKMKSEPRLFDSDEVKWGKHVADFQRPVESPQALVQNPPAAIFITPIDYDKEIRDYLKSLIGLKLIRVISLKEIYQWKK